jgi:hypothetical protein
MGIIPGTVVPASDEVIEAIAGIERQRLAMENEAGRVASCGSALRKLHGLLEQEKEAAQSRGADAGQPGNVQAVTIEIERVKKLAVITGQGPLSRRADPTGLRQVTWQKSWQNARRNPARNKGRRTMGRAGGR